MNEKVISILKEKPIIIPQILFKNYRKLKITEEELIILIYIINLGEKTIYAPQKLAQELNIDKYKVMQLLNNLFEKNIINMKVEKNSNNISEEYIYIDQLYNRLLNIIIEEPTSPSIPDTDILSLFESELGRTLSPTECLIINEWLNENYSEELIKEALKEAVYNNVRNLKYIEKILYTWKTKGIKTKEDVLRDKKKYRKPITQLTDVFDYNWLEEE